MNNSSVLKLFKILNEKEAETKEILQSLKIKMPTFYKNIKKIKEAGFNIRKRNNLYSLEEYKGILVLDNCEKSAIAYMINAALKLLPKYKYKKFQNFIRKFLLLAKKEDYDEVIKKFELIKKYSLIEEYEEKIDNIETFMANRKNAKITLRSNKTIVIKPLKFDWKKEKIFLIYINLNNGEDEKINIEQIAKIEHLKEKSYINDDEVIFELYGILAKRYLLKKDERIVKNKKDSVVIGSKTNDKEALFRRLLRYDTLCKILFPKYEVDSFNKLIDKAIINLDESYE